MNETNFPLDQTIGSDINNGKSRNWLVLGLFFLLLLMGVIIWWLYLQLIDARSQNKSLSLRLDEMEFSQVESEKKVSKEGEAQAEIQPAIEKGVDSQLEPVISITPEAEVCNSYAMGFKLVLPAIDWNCEVREISDTEGVMSIKAPNRLIDISNLGRGFFCNPEADLGCEIENWQPAGHALSFTKYYQNSQLKEITTIINKPNLSPSGSIIFLSVHDSSQTIDELSDSEESNLIKLLESVAFRD